MNRTKRAVHAIFCFWGGKHDALYHRHGIGENHRPLAARSAAAGQVARKGMLQIVWHTILDTVRNQKEG